MKIYYLFFIFSIISCKTIYTYERVTDYQGVSKQYLSEFIYIQKNNQVLKIRAYYFSNKIVVRKNVFISKMDSIIHIDTNCRFTQSINYSFRIDNKSLKDKKQLNKGLNLYDFFGDGHSLVKILDTVNYKSKKYLLLYKPAMLYNHGKIPESYYFINFNENKFPEIIAQIGLKSDSTKLVFHQILLRKKIKYLNLPRVGGTNLSNLEYLGEINGFQYDTTQNIVSNFTEDKINFRKNSKLNMLIDFFEVEVLKHMKQ